MDLWILIELQDIVPSGWGEMQVLPLFFHEPSSGARGWHPLNLRLSICKLDQDLDVSSIEAPLVQAFAHLAPSTGCIPHPPICLKHLKPMQGYIHLNQALPKNPSWNQDTLVMRSICARLCHDLLNSWPMIPGWFTQKVLKIVHGARISLEDGK